MMRWMFAWVVPAFLFLGLFTSHTTAQDAPAPTQEDDTAWLWSFDEGQGATTKEKRHGRTAELHGGAEWSDGQHGPAIRFNGRDGLVKLAGDSAMVFAAEDSLTLEVWLRVTKIGQTQQILFSPGSAELEVRGESGAVSFNLTSPDKGNARCTGRIAITDGKWHHVAAVRDGQADELRLYIDGELDVRVDDPTAGGRVMIHLGSSIGGKVAGSEMLGGAIEALRLSTIARTYQPFATHSDAAVDHYKLANDHVEMTFQSIGSTLTLSSLIDKSSGVEFIEADLPRRKLDNLWHVALRGEVGDAVLNEAVGQVTVEAVRDGDQQTLIFRWDGLELDDGTTVGVTATVALPDDSPMSDWRIDVDNPSEQYGVWTVRFPRINNLGMIDADPLKQFVVIPGGNGGGAGEGQLYEDPWKTMDHAFVRTYPCYHQSMQFNAWYGPEAGLYLATHDGEAHLKGFLVEPIPASQGPTGTDTPPTLRYEVHHYPADAGVAGTAFHQPYPAIVGTFRGDWYDAARVYRGWALDQFWAAKGPTYQRDDISPWIKAGAWWVMFPLDRTDDDRPLLRNKARTLPYEEVRRLARHVDVEKTVANAEKAYDYFGFPMLLWCNEWWEGGGDTSPPRYTPVNNLEEMLAELDKRVPAAHFSGHIQPKRYSIQVAEYDDRVEASLEKEPDGRLAISAPMPDETMDQHAYPCWATDFWQDFWWNKTVFSAKLGLDGYHVDELGSATSFDAQCFNRDHGHPVGGGTLYVETRRKLTQILRDAARTVKPDFAVHHEVLNEIYIDLADAAEVCTAPSNRNIPMYEAVYHDHLFIMGRRIMEWTDRNLFPFDPNNPDKGDEGIDEYVSSYAQTYIWGNQPSWTRVDIVDYAPKIAAFIKRTMEARYRALDYLNFGDMMRPLVLTEPLPTVDCVWRYTDTPEHTLPVVFNSVWKAPDGSVGIVLFNITDQPQEIAYRSDLAECGLTSGSHELTRIDGETPEPLGTFEGDVLKRRDTVEPRSVKIIAVTPSERVAGAPE